MKRVKEARRRNKLLVLINIILIGILIAVTFALVVFGLNSVPVTKALIIGGFISAVSGYFELFVFPRILKKLNFLSLLFIKTFFYVAVVSVPVMLLWIVHESILNDTDILTTLQSDDFRRFLFKGDFKTIFIFSLIAGFSLNFFLQLSSLIGRKVFFRYLSGRYHKPVSEVRVFMFLDLTSSTTIAEKLSPVEFHKFMNSYFYDIDDPIVETRGEIYQYAGDEVIISWKEKDAFTDSNCIQCYFKIRELIKSVEDKYLNEFGVVPTFRGGLHIGTVVAGEIGDSKREIVFHGDVMNTASRIQGMSKELKLDLVMSDEVYERLDRDSGFLFSHLGEYSLKGKSNKVPLYSVSLKG